MPPYGEPDWTSPSNAATSTQDAGTGLGASGVPVAASKEAPSNSRRNARVFLVFLSFINMGLSAAMGSLGVLTCINTTASIDDLTDMMLGVYMTIFACILFIYELCWWQPIPAINRSFRKNFGFMYGLNSKGLYLIFIAFLCLGLTDENNSGVDGLDWVSGIGWLASGVVHIAVALTWSETVEVYRPPTAGLDTTPDEESNMV
mmetsp:Transcript_7603/g.9947  ORF Transcript_7603/g.9947 Transcript_7603/m.9947 type:complete len:203 (-) Transcript_7603:263-871(-)|eukprot:CAMPEP_0198142050 /NCGR_PEP_ID=MMETSP1443-20131203/4950_1 /TAXON_ID=186043 /ORGANISM="Entomoneis sp., Strain CCMP2396" /LENGTH=202 /DNA_ID=CAMNT_0043804985 /DNA_START=75 /DNA_END=683 /DNA_ORIENTATION=-